MRVAPTVRLLFPLAITASRSASHVTSRFDRPLMYTPLSLSSFTSQRALGLSAVRSRTSSL